MLKYGRVPLFVCIWSSQEVKISLFVTKTFSAFYFLSSSTENGKIGLKMIQRYHFVCFVWKPTKMFIKFYNIWRYWCINVFFLSFFSLKWYTFAKCYFCQLASPIYCILEINGCLFWVLLSFSFQNSLHYNNYF